MDTQNAPYTAQLIFDCSSMTDIEASIQLNHKKETDTTAICMKDGVELFVCGTPILTNPKGRVITGTEVMGIIHTEVNATKEELLDFLCFGNDKFDGYSIVKMPTFQWMERDGASVGEDFGVIPKDLSSIEAGEFYL